jgi:FKBP-type peptidyl-prolyl cis-trans isomerase FkpA
MNLNYNKNNMKKRNIYLLLLMTVLGVISSCGNLDYKKTKSGLLYKIIKTKDSKSSPVTAGNILKLYYAQKLNDSVLQTNYGKLPLYLPVEANVGDVYNPSEIFNKLHKGDSAVTVLLIDSLLKKGMMQSLPPFMKKGDREIITFKVVDVFPSDSIARIDGDKEMKIEMGRQQQQDAVEKVKEDKELRDWLAKKGISAERAPNGTFVHIDQPGTGMAIDSGKNVTIKYTGKKLADEQVFQSSSYSFVIDAHQAIPGWDDGLKFFKQGGKGTLYVPGVLAYGANPPQGSPFKPYESLIFDIEVSEVKVAPAPNKTPMINPDTLQRKK